MVGRKRIDVDPATGPFVETMLATPLALGYLIYLARAGALAFGHHGRPLDVLLGLLGPITALPLLLLIWAGIALYALDSIRSARRAETADAFS